MRAILRNLFLSILAALSFYTVAPVSGAEQAEFKTIIPQIPCHASKAVVGDTFKAWISSGVGYVMAYPWGAGIDYNHVSIPANSLLVADSLSIGKQAGNMRLMVVGGTDTINNNAMLIQAYGDNPIGLELINNIMDNTLVPPKTTTYHAIWGLVQGSTNWGIGAASAGDIVIGNLGHNIDFVVNPTNILNDSWRRMFIRNDGYVSIGNSSGAHSPVPDPGTYRLKVWGPVRCKSLDPTSDMRLKKDIIPIEHPIATILKIRGVSFEWNDKTGPSFLRGRHDGVIAQEIERVLPGLTEKGDGLKSINYNELIPILIEALKEQHEEIGLLRKKIEGLKEERKGS